MAPASNPAESGRLMKVASSMGMEVRESDEIKKVAISTRAATSAEGLFKSQGRLGVVNRMMSDLPHEKAFLERHSLIRKSTGGVAPQALFDREFDPATTTQASLGDVRSAGDQPSGLSGMDWFGIIHDRAKAEGCTLGVADGQLVCSGGQPSERLQTWLVAHGNEVIEALKK